MHAYAIAHAEHVVRFAQPRYEAVSREAQATHRSLAARARTACSGSSGRGARICSCAAATASLFLADKVVESDGRRVLVEPLTNVWDDIGFQGIAREGGVRFVRSKKPEKLVARILAMSTDPGDWVLDAFLGQRDDGGRRAQDGAPVGGDRARRPRRRALPAAAPQRRRRSR